MKEEGRDTQQLGEPPLTHDALTSQGTSEGVSLRGEDLRPDGRPADTKETSERVTLREEALSEGEVAKLRAAFQKDGTVTAGNASGIVDGASALTIASEESASSMGLKPIGRIVSYAAAGVEPSEMGIGPVPATKAALERAGLSLSDIDLIEVNEAFAAQYLAVERELGLDRERVNVNGGAIALGHPLGSSGTRLVLTLLHELRRRKARYGLATACIGGGQGIAMIVEALN